MTHTPADWTAALFFAVGVFGAYSTLFHLLVDADLADFDPRPAARRAVDAVHQGVVHAGHDLNRAIATGQRTARALRADTAWTVAALLILAMPQGDNR
ncbi:hypothetical protein ACWC3Y_11205 [Streptomyces sp. NPDC001296]